MNANFNSRNPEDASPQPTVEDSCPLCGGNFSVDDSVNESPRTCSSCGLILRSAEPKVSDSDPIEELVEEQPDPLDRWLAGEPIESAALPDTNASWFSRAKSHPVATTAVCMALVAAIAILCIPTIVLRHEREAFGCKQAESKLHYERLLAEKEQQRLQLLGQVEAAEGKYNTAEQRLAGAIDELRVSWAKRLAAHSQRLREKDPHRSLLLATEAIHATLSEGSPQVPQAQQTLRDALQCVDGRRLLGHTARITSLAISPDSRVLASGSFDRTVRLWDLSANANSSSPSSVLRGHEGCVSDVKFSPDSRVLASGSFDKTVRLWNLSEKVHPSSSSSNVLRSPEGCASDVKFSPDSRVLASASPDKTVHLLDLSANATPSSLSTVLRGRQGYVGDVKYSPDSRWLTNSSLDSTARVWGLFNQEPTDSSQVFRGHRGRVGVIAISSDSRWIVTGSSGYIPEENTVCLWDLSAQDPARSLKELRGLTGQIHVVAISPDNRWVLAAGEDGMARLWDLSAGQPEMTSFLLYGHKGAINSATFTADSKYLVTGSQSTISASATLRLWRTSDRPPFDSIVLDGHASGVKAIVATPDSRRLISVGNDSQIRIWNLNPFDPSADSLTIPRGSEQITTVAVSPDSRCLATGDDNGTTRLWDLASLGKQEAESSAIVFAGRKSPISKIAISPDNHWLVTAAEDGEIHVRTLHLEELVDLALERVVWKNDIVSSTK